MKKFTAFLMVLVLLVSFAGCSEVAGDIAGNVADAAKKELENQIKATFETYKIDILDMKSAVGKLNGETSDYIPWGAGEPSYRDAYGNSENFLLLVKNANGIWEYCDAVDDITSLYSGRMGYIMEK